jgi:hypothetical protein
VETVARMLDDLDPASLDELEALDRVLHYAISRQRGMGRLRTLGDA